MQSQKLRLVRPPEPAKTRLVYTEANDILSQKDRRTLTQARSRAKAGAEFKKVGSYDRKFYRLGLTAGVLARWEDLETALFRICSRIDRMPEVSKHAISKENRRRAFQVITLLEDTFEINRKA